LRWWLQKGEALPLTTNAIESHFSQICNRVKRIGDGGRIAACSIG